MKLRPGIALVCLWLAWLVAGPAISFGQGTFVYQQWVNPNPRPGVPWDDSGFWVQSSPINPTPLNVDMDLDGTTDFRISSDGSHLAIFATGNGEIYSLRSPPPDLGGYAARLPAGQSISSLTPVPYEWMETINVFGQPIGATLLYSNTAGQLGFWGGQFGYLGVRIQKNGDWLYGWIRGGCPLSIVPEGIFYEAALNLTPNAGIFAGAVPEPSCVSLCVLGILLMFARRSQSRARLLKKQALNAFLALVCLTATSARCAIVYSPGPASQSPSWFFPFSQNVDLDSDGVDDFVFPVGPTFCTMDYPSSGSWTPFYVAAAGTNEFLVSGYYSSVQSFGAWIGGAPPLDAPWSTPGATALLTDQWWSLYGRDIGGQLVHSGWGGPLAISGVGYLSVRFYQPDGLHYGWIRALLSSPMVLDWAYETVPNKPIRTGDIDSTRKSVQFTVEFLTPHPRPRHPAQAVGTGSLILTGNTLRGELTLAGQFSSAQILDPNHRRTKDRLVSDFGQPLVSTTDHTAFFHDATLTRSQVNQLLHGEYYVSIDNGALAARVLPTPPARHGRDDRR